MPAPWDASPDPEAPTNGPDQTELSRRSQPVSITRTRKFSMWSGPPERLIRLTRIVEECLDASPEPMEESTLLGSRWKKGSELQVEVRGAEGRMKRLGGVEDVLADMDARDIEFVRISNARLSFTYSTETGVEVLLGSEFGSSSFDSAGITVAVAGHDRNWVSASYDRVVTHVQRDVPWWGVFRTTRGVLLLSAVLYLLLGAIYAAYAAINKNREWGDIAGELLAYLFAYLGAVVVLGFALRRWVLPPVEVVEPGSKPRARRYLAVTVGLIGFALAVAGLLVSL